MSENVKLKIFLQKYCIYCRKINKYGKFYVYNYIFVFIRKSFIVDWCIADLFFSSPGPLGHVSYCHHFSSVVRHPSVNISHFNLLLRNHWANCNQTLVEWSLDGPLPNLCPVIPTSNQDGHQAQNRKKGGWNFNWPLLL